MAAIYFSNSKFEMLEIKKKMYKPFHKLDILMWLQGFPLKDSIFFQRYNELNKGYMSPLKYFDWI